MKYGDIQGLSSEDFNLYYSGCCVNHTHQGETHLRMVSGETRRNDDGIKTAIVYDIDNPENQWKPKIEERYIDFLEPKLGLVNIGKFFIYTSRSGQQTNRKLLIPNEIQKHNPFLEEAMNHDFKVKTFKIQNCGKTYEAIYNPEYPDAREALEDVRSFRKMGVALSPNLGIRVMDGYTHPILVYKCFSVGWIEEDGHVVLPTKSHHLFEEISGLLMCERRDI